MTSTNRRRELQEQESSPIVSWLHRFSAFALIFLSAAFTIWYRLDDSFMNRGRALISDVFRPLTLAVYAPVVGAQMGIESIADHFETVAKLDQAQAELARIDMLEEEIQRLEAQLKSARDLAKFPIETVSDYLTLRVINADHEAVWRDKAEVLSLTNLPDRKLIKINAGQAFGVQAGLPVISDVGLVGRVVWAGRQTAVVMLVYDVNMSVPALIENLDATATVTGTGQRDLLEIKRATSEVLAETQVGDRIVTSGQGELFPPGVLIGHVVGKEKGVQIKPAVDWDRLVHVRVLPRSGERR